MFTSVLKLALIPLAAGAFIFAQASDDLPARGPLPFKAYDKDKNGVISETEFYGVQAKRMEQRAEEGRPMRNAGNAPKFEEFDANGDGGITPQELQEGQAKRMQERGGKGMGPR